MLASRPIPKDGYRAWENTTREYLVRSFGADSPNVSAVMQAGHVPVFFVGGAPMSAAQIEAEAEDDRAKTLTAQLAMLESCLEQLEAERDIATPTSPQRAHTQHAESVFLVHGRNDGMRETVARFLERLELDVVVLQEQPNLGRTIIEKFEEHAAEAGFAVVLMTGDDRGGLHTDDPVTYSPRARQNVIFELGYFAGKLGRGKVCALHGSGVEIPSDYQGVAYVPLDIGDTWKYQLGREMRAAGLPVDLNRI